MRDWWRALLIAAGVLIAWGGSMHPGFEVARARHLFRGVVLLALWLILAGVWPSNAPTAQRAVTRAP